MGKDYGEPIRFDPDFSGPVRHRSCTDIFWLILFIIVLGGWGYVGYYSISNGNIEKLLAPMDSNGHRCGMDSKVENKKYLVFFDISVCLSPQTPITGCKTPQVCVEKCPDQTIMFNTLTNANFNDLKRHLVCTYDIDINSLTYNQAVQHIQNGNCAKYVLSSQSVTGRCLPDVESVKSILEDASQWTEDQLSGQLTNLIRLNQLASQIVEDLVQSRWYMLGGLIVVILICFIYILLLRWVVAPVVWASIVGLFAALGFALYLCYKNYAYYKANPVTLMPTTNLQSWAESLLTDHKAWMAFLIILGIITLILLLIVIFLRNRIVLSIALIREGSRAVSAVKTTVFFPIFPWIIQCAAIAYGVLVLMYLLSIGEPAFKVVNLQNATDCCQGEYANIKDYESCTPEKFSQLCTSSYERCQNAVCHFTGLENTVSSYYFHAINLFVFFWTMFFISGIADMILASTFSTWYWTFHKRDLPFFTLAGGIGRTLRYHLGTVAFGALIIAIVRMIRVVLEYIDQKVKKFDNFFTRCIMCCCKCFFMCLESFLKFINKNAYIMCAVHGTAFCKSASDAFSLLMRNIVRVVVLDKVTDFIFFLSKLLISTGIGFAVYYLLEWNLFYEVTRESRLHYSYIPAVILSIATFLISSIFFNVYSMAVDTLFICFLEDCERNDGSPDKPYFMSKNLMKILGKKNKI